MSAPIRVLIVDDHEMVRSGLAAFLYIHADMELVGEAGDGAEAIRVARECCPDVVLMDMVMPVMNGPTAIQAVREICPLAQVIALTSFKEQELIQQAMEAGAISFLYKNITADDLVKAIRAAHAGQPTLAQEALQAIIQAKSQPPKPGHDLTDREREVLACMVKGLNNVEIAQQLVVSRSTVKAHVSNILAKLDVSSRTEAVALAVQHSIN
ncbi:MAG: response regulator transcription factor [Anaerolineae bacterium]|nr:response regulator transcription factor [Anaerolineae bacterium]